MQEIDKLSREFGISGYAASNFHIFQLTFHINVKSWLAPLIQLCRPKKETGNQIPTIELKD